jgi:hypothetical protein
MCGQKADAGCLLQHGGLCWRSLLEPQTQLVTLHALEGALTCCAAACCCCCGFVQTLLPLTPTGELCDLEGNCVDPAEDEIFKLTTQVRGLFFLGGLGGVGGCKGGWGVPLCGVPAGRTHRPVSDVLLCQL